MTDDIVRSLYKAAASCADHHDDEFLKALHIKTPIDEVIVSAAQENKIVIVTGNPGDGKTHLIRQLQGKIPAVMVNRDANQSEDRQLIEELDEAYRSQSPFVIAINEGVLLSICEQAKSQSPWAQSVIQSILKPYIYDNKEPKANPRLLILDLNLRNNLAKHIVEQAIKKVVDLVDPNGALAENARRLKHPDVVKRLVDLLDAVARTGYHATMRDLLGFIAYLLCGGEEDPEAERPRPYYINAFVGGIGSIFEQVRKFDPIRIPAPFLDDQLFMCLDDDAKWVLKQPSERRIKEDIALFMERKRRAFFEHKDGSRIPWAEQRGIDKIFDDLTQNNDPKLIAIRLLNRFFEGGEVDYDNLILWVGHQYWAKSIRFVASRETVSANDLEVRVPRLPEHIRNAFPQHYPDHVVLIHRLAQDISDGLVINRNMIAMLLAGDRFSSTGTRNAEALAKIAAFYNRLGKHSNKHNVVQILRLDTADKVRIGVSVNAQMDQSSYFIPGGG